MSLGPTKFRREARLHAFEGVVMGERFLYSVEFIAAWIKEQRIPVTQYDDEKFGRVHRGVDSEAADSGHAVRRGQRDSER